KPVQDWVLGQLATAEAAAVLLAYRANSEAAPWPELAEYDCFACHHDLKAKSWRQTTPKHYEGRLAGSLPRGTWYYSMPRALAEGLPGNPATGSLKVLTTTMVRPLPERKAAAELANALARDLEGLRKSLKEFGAKDLLGTLQRVHAAGPPQSW